MINPWIWGAALSEFKQTTTLTNGCEYMEELYCVLFSVFG
jgi:hypothetical protein